MRAGQQYKPFERMHRPPFEPHHAPRPRTAGLVEREQKLVLHLTTSCSRRLDQHLRAVRLGTGVSCAGRREDSTGPHRLTRSRWAAWSPFVRPAAGRPSNHRGGGPEVYSWIDDGERYMTEVAVQALDVHSARSFSNRALHVE
jgi:hypothetical protein